MTKHEPFIMLPHAVYDSPEFAALEPIHVALLLLLLRKHNGFNNGDIPLGTREVEKRCHCGHATACRALKRLETDGLITATYKGHLVPEIGRPNVATRWRLTFLEERLPRSTTEPSGRFSSGPSPANAVRSSSGPSPRGPLQEQYIDNLTRTKSEGSGGTKGREATPPSAPGGAIGVIADEAGPTAEQSNPGKPNGKDHGTLQHAGGDTIH